MTSGTTESTQRMAIASFCACGCGRPVAHDPHQNTRRFFASEACAARALAKRFGYVSRVGAVNPSPTTTMEDSTMRSKTVKKAAAAKKSPRTSSPTDYTKEKLAVQGECKVGSTMIYRGLNKAFAGKRVKVTGHESRGGIFIAFGDKTLTCSPFALLGRPDAPSKPKPGKAKAAKTPAPKVGKGKAGRTPAPAKKSPQSPAPAPTQAPAAPAEPAPAPAKPQAKARKAA